MKLSDYEKAETSNIDYKESLEKIKPKSWLKSVSAFANTKGGTILFGIKDKDGNVNGYIVGAKLYNMIGLTTQVPNITDIVTNECKYHKIFYNNLRVNILKPKIAINNENYLYLQLLDIIENKDNINIEVDNFDEIIFKIIDNSNLEFEKLIKYARITKNKKAIEKLIEIAR